MCVVTVYDVLTGAVVSKLSGHDACVRDVSWHPYEDTIVSSSVSVNVFTFTGVQDRPAGHILLPGYYTVCNTVSPGSAEGRLPCNLGSCDPHWPSALNLLSNIIATPCRPS